MTKKLYHTLLLLSFTVIGPVALTAQSKISWDTTFVQGIYSPTVYGTEDVGLWLRNDDTAAVTITSLTTADTTAWKPYYDIIDSIPPFIIAAGDSAFVRFRLIAKDTALAVGILRATTATDTIYAIVQARPRLPSVYLHMGATIPTSAQLGVPDTIKLSTDPFTLDPFRPEGKDSLMLFWRDGGDSLFQGWLNFNKITVTNPNPPFEIIDQFWMALTPGTFGDYISSTGYEFFIRLRVGAYVVTLPQATAQTNPYKLTTILSDGIKKNGPQPIGTTAQQYKMISVPVFLNNEDPAVVLSNFGVSDTTWKLLTWRNGDYIDSKTPGFPGFRPGRGYWFITKVPDTLRTGVAQSTPLSNFNISLIPGWNMIGTPFNFAIAWTDVMNVPMNVVPYFWEGQDYSVRSTLYPWEGFFVSNEDQFNNVTITVPPRRAPGMSTWSSFSFAKSLNAGEWRLQLRSESGWMKDNFNYVGVMSTATDELDPTDYFDAPKHPGDEYLQLRSVTADGKALAADFRSPGQNHVWNIEVNVKSSDGMVRIAWDRPDEISNGWVAYLIDTDAHLAINLSHESFYSFAIPKNTAVRRRLKLVTGSIDYVRQQSSGILLIPDHFDLAGNYPNPFNPITTIRFDLPVVSRVTLTIHNSLGQLVTRLVDQTMAEGTHTLLWNGRGRDGNEVASGVYFARLHAESPAGRRFSKTQKMLLLK